MFGSGGGAGYALHTDDDNYDDLDLPPYMGSFNFGESDPDLVEGVEVVDGERFYSAMAPVDHHLSSSTIATDDADGMITDDPSSLLLEPAIPSDDYELGSTTSSSEANATNVAAGADISSPSLHAEMDLATGSTKMVQSSPVLMSQRRTNGNIATGISTSALAAAALTNEFHRLDSTSSSTRDKQAQSSSVDQERSVSAEENSDGSTPSENENKSPSTPRAKGGGKRKAATVAAAGVGIAALAFYGNRILKRFRDDDGDNEEAANYEIQDQDLGGDLYVQQQQGQAQAQAQPQSQGQAQGQTAQGPTGAEQGAAQAGQAMAQTQLQVAQAMVAQASSGIASSAGAVGGAAGATAAAAAAATAAGEALLGYSIL